MPSCTPTKKLEFLASTDALKWWLASELGELAELGESCEFGELAGLGESCEFGKIGELKKLGESSIGSWSFIIKINKTSRNNKLFTPNKAITMVHH